MTINNFRAALIHICILTVEKCTMCHLKGVIQLWGSPQLYITFWHLSNYYFGFTAHNFTVLVQFDCSHPAAAGSCFQQKSSDKPVVHTVSKRRVNIGLKIIRQT